MMTPSRRAMELEQALGSADDPRRTLSHARAVALDATGAFPAAANAELDALGVNRLQIPAHLGGDLRSMAETGAVFRAVARRDLTAAVSYFKTLLGALPVWAGGSAEQQRMLAGAIIDGARVALGLTEREHGADLVQTSTKATRVNGGVRITGEKWLINNATRGRYMSVLAATRPGAGARACTFFLVDKSSLPPDAYTHLPRIQTHGVRGIDLSGITFREAFVPVDAQIGDDGGGIELALRFLQVSKTLIAHLALGCADSALRLTIRFASRRHLYGAPVFAIGHARDLVADAFAEGLVLDAATHVFSRAFHVVPQEASLLAGIAKYLVPVRCEAIFNDLAVVLGARHFLAEGETATFEKHLRDHRLLSLFDGSTVVNLTHVASQLPSWARARADAPRTRDIFVVGDDDGIVFSQLALHAAGRCTPVAGSAELATRVKDAANIDDDLREALVGLARRASQVLEGVADVALRAPPPARSTSSIAMARRFCAAVTTVSAIELWLSARPTSRDPFFARGAWLAVGAPRVLGGEQDEVLDALRASCAREAVRRTDENRSFGLSDHALG
jgi:alkylation response protein AidB-like acyl-CoA dehydrogenase